eukprot:365032-Chlamydomonas_euryale.AAC.21
MKSHTHAYESAAPAREPAPLAVRVCRGVHVRAPGQQASDAARESIQPCASVVHTRCRSSATSASVVPRRQSGLVTPCRRAHPLRLRCRCE